MRDPASLGLRRTNMSIEGKKEVTQAKHTERETTDHEPVRGMKNTNRMQTTKYKQSDGYHPNVPNAIVDRLAVSRLLKADTKARTAMTVEEAVNAFLSQVTLRK